MEQEDRDTVDIKGDEQVILEEATQAEVEEAIEEIEDHDSIVVGS